MIPKQQAGFRFVSAFFAVRKTGFIIPSQKKRKTGLQFHTEKVYYALLQKQMTEMNRFSG